MLKVDNLDAVLYQNSPGRQYASSNGFAASASSFRTDKSVKLSAVLLSQKSPDKTFENFNHLGEVDPNPLLDFDSMPPYYEADPMVISICILF